LKGRKIGYARVSTRDQDVQLQLDALAAAGCADADIYRDDGVSGALASRPGLDACLAALAPGDTLVVWKLDRLGRSLQHLVEIVAGLRDRGTGFASLTEGIDTTTNGGRLVFHIFAALAEFERGLIRERTVAGLEAARARGRTGGRPRALDARQAALARKLINGGTSASEVARTLKVGRASLYRALEREQEGS
jgi:DNA invertase Pin-like site-specific DNA recombinase